MITCPACDFKAINFKGLNYDPWSGTPPACPKCGAGLKWEPMKTPPNFRDSVVAELSCPNCAAFDKTTVCTGFGARLEGTCRIYTAGIVSHGSTCDAIDVDDDWVVQSLSRGIAGIPPSIMKKLVQHLLQAPGVIAPGNDGFFRAIVETFVNEYDDARDDMNAERLDKAIKDLHEKASILLGAGKKAISRSTIRRVQARRDRFSLMRAFVSATSVSISRPVGPACPCSSRARMRDTPPCCTYS
jgi:hypothetical protein